MTKQPPTVAREPLRWLFIAHFADGSTIEQDQADRSTTRTDGSGSTFTDVLARQDDLVAFELVNDQQSVMVDLQTGAFIVNGTPLHIHDQYFEPQHHSLRLIYFRETRVDLDPDRNESTHYTNRYFIGWQTTVNGKNKQATLAVG